ncbi:MAG: hypothetical protein BWK75_02410 [Candidatus Altiarchaeales archaeon A3]|nr:MAG: hypothetical protein BWK75_02410 [Candidatus Altiarchaeales archaeon A3]
MQKVFKIKGMHCNSCAQLIEVGLKSKVNNVSASYPKETVEIDFDSNIISENEIKNEIKTLGYEVVDEKEENEKNKKDKISKKKSIYNKIILYILLGFIIIFAAVLYFFVFKNIELPEVNLPQMGENVSLALLFIAGLLTGFHCMAMCGGFVVSYTVKNALIGHKGFSQHLVYGGGKVISYTIIGGIFGLIGGIFTFSIELRSWVAILSGIFIIFYALGMLGIKFFRRFQFNPKFIHNITGEANKYKGYYLSPLVIGLLNGLFIACGPLQAMYIYAAGIGSFVSGAISMAVFGIGTLPVMLILGSFATAISRKTTEKILKLSAIIVLILGIIMLNTGLTLMGSPLTLDSIKDRIIGIDTSNSSVKIENGVQTVNMDMDSQGYHPNSFVVKKGIPVKWKINVTELTPCNNEIIMNAYSMDVKLKQGINDVIEFTPDKTGTISFSCSMGMLKGSFIVTESGIASQEEITAATPYS